jgi:hypothetical protein
MSDLNIELAERLMGWHLEGPEWYDSNGVPQCQYAATEHHKPFNPSTNITAALQVIEAMRGRGYWFKMNYGYIGDPIGYVYFDEKDWADPNPMYFERYEGIEQLPAAICRCALAALSALEGRDGSV